MPRGCAIALLTATAFFGVFLALAAMAFLVVSETQVDLAGIARESRAVRADDPSAPEGELVSLTGTIALDAPLGDGMFLAPGDYLAVERIVEMYAWEEYRDGEDAGGKPRYRERKVWTRSPESGLLNPSMPFRGAKLVAPGAQIGAVRVDPQAADLPLADPLPLSKALLLPSAEGVIDEEGRLRIGKGPLSRPQIGDLRVSYRVAPAGRLVTVFASLDGGRMAPYQAADGRAIYKVIEGDRESALQELGAVQLIGGWLVRLLSGAALWFGLLLLFYGSRRLFDWPGRLGIATGSVRLAAALGIATAVLTVVSLWLGQGSLAALAAALGVEALAAGLWVVWLRGRARAGGASAAAAP